MDILKKYPCKSPMTASRVINGQAIVIFMEDEGKKRESKISVFNSVGSHVWTILNGKKTVGQIVDSITGEYDIAYKKAEEKIIQFLLNLSERKLIIISNIPG